MFKKPKTKDIIFILILCFFIWAIGTSFAMAGKTTVDAFLTARPMQEKDVIKAPDETTIKQIIYH